MRVVIFGGSFNPPHIAHVLALCTAKAYLAPDKLLVMPTYQHPFGKALAPFEDRLRMCELAMGWIPGTEVARVEEELGGASRTLRTLQHLRSKHPDWEMRLLIGSDVMVDAPKWHAFDEVCALAPPLLVGRVGHLHPAAPAPILPEVSSTEIRQLLLERSEETQARLMALVPREVLQHIAAQGLYRAVPSP
jgi:nicotinate-nucleotide adenylyltransferase